MAARLSHTSLQAELVRRGLPVDYVDRVLDELRDHHADAAEEIARDCGDLERASELAEIRLGEPAVLARQIVSGYRARYFAARHPLLTFLVAPLPVVLLAWAAYLSIAFLVLTGFESMFPSSGDWAGEHLWILRGVDFLLVFAVPLLVSASFCRLARRSCAGLGWMAVSTAWICLAAFSLQTQITPPTMGPGSGTYMVGLGRHTPALFGSDWAHILQAVVPCLALAATLLARRWAILRQTSGLETT